MAALHEDSFLDEPDGLKCRRRIGFEQELREAFQIRKRRLGIDQPRQATDFGRAPGRPMIRARRYSCTTSASYPFPVRSAALRALSAWATNDARSALALADASIA